MTDWKKLTVEWLRSCEAHCENCLYWKQDDEDLIPTTGIAGEDPLGWCQRNPPSADENHFAIWPITSSFDFCGEYTPGKRDDELEA